MNHKLKGIWIMLPPLNNVDFLWLTDKSLVDTFVLVRLGFTLY